MFLIDQMYDASCSFNQFKPTGISHRYQLEQSISVLRDVGWYFFIFIQILIENSASKRWRSRPDTAFCGVWSGSALFAYVPENGHQTYLIWVIILLSTKLD